MKPQKKHEPPKEVWNSHNVASRATATGGTLYVKVHSARLMQDISPTSDVLAILSPGDVVTWHGAHETDKRWHKISVTIHRAIPNPYHSNINPPLFSRVTGYIFGSNLSTTPPDMTLRAKEGKREMNPTAYANTGAIKG